MKNVDTSLETGLAEYVQTRLATAGWPGITVHLGRLGLTDMLGPALADLPGERLGGSGEVLAIHLRDDSAIVGPIDTPARLDGRRSRPCHLCLVRRWQAIQAQDERNILETGPGFQTVDGNPYLTAFALALIGDVAEYLVEERPRDAAGRPHVYQVGLSANAVRRYPLVADSECPACAEPEPDRPDNAVIELAPITKLGPDAFRLRSATDYRLPVDTYVNPLCGPLGARLSHRLASTTTAAAIGHFAVRGDGYVHDSFWGGHADSFAESEVLGIMEALERHAGLRPRRKQTVVHGTHADLRDRAMDPRECGLYADSFYERNARYYTSFHEDLTIPWVWGYSLRDRRPILVPEQLAYYHLPSDPAKFVQECSNGCAAGSCLGEAVFHGLLELIERDAFLISWYGGSRLPEIDPDSCQRIQTRMLMDRISLSGYDVRIFDTRVDFPIPVVTVVGMRRVGGPGRLCFAAGAGFDPEDAVASALREIAHTVPSFPAYSAAETDELKAMADDFRRVSRLADHPRLFGLHEMADHADFLLGGPRRVRPLQEVYQDWHRLRPSGPDLSEDLRFCVDQVASAGIDVIVVDQTSPEQLELGVHTACVIAPGLVPIDFGWERQRALHMPRTRTALHRGGRRDRPLEAAELNYVPHPFP
ncbi:TOMM precursor leader peptide-binding protein [Sphaerimonospora sp. CA-214678]|uniref:TOMM precursor leader peptide-binding protein n=1 Tax=Sphaerimonospora sp. CA-214678 TaxID=3240029 RepID=UPI003D8C8452